MSQQFRVESQAIRDKLNSLLPSQNRGSIGVDLSGSTTIIPVVDLTEIAEGSSLRDDLQKSLSLNSVTEFDVSDTLSTIINTTGYFSIQGHFVGCNSTSSDFATNQIRITDGTTTKVLFNVVLFASSTQITVQTPFNLLVKLQAGDSVQINTGNGGTGLSRMVGVSRQIATLSGELVNP